ncbi:MAG: hypothetical protein WCH65_03410 [bacterium]
MSRIQNIEENRKDIKEIDKENISIRCKKLLQEIPNKDIKIGKNISESSTT